MISIQSVRKSYGQIEALQGVTLGIQEGEFFGLLGPNGAGKSTLMGILSGYLGADAGAVTIGGLPVGPAQLEARQLVGLAPQALALYDDLTAEANLRLFGRLFGLGSGELRQRSNEMLDLTGLTERRADRVKTFSGGMKRRLNLAVALLHRPKVLLCDEPTVGVDPQSRLAIFDFLQERCRLDRLTIVYTTHYMEEVQRLCPRIAIIDHGRIIAQGRLDELLGQALPDRILDFPAQPQYLEPRSRWATFGRLETDGETAALHLDDHCQWSSVFAHIEQNGWPVARFRPRSATLESLFLKLTGRTLRD